VVSLKEAADLVGIVPDLVINNFVNMRCAGPQRGSLSLLMAARDFMTAIPHHFRCHGMLPYAGGVRRTGVRSVQGTVLGRGDFDRWRLEATLERPWGPGVFYELAIFLAPYLRSPRMLTVGVDGFRNDGPVEHGYREPAGKRLRWVVDRLGRIFPLLPMHSFRYALGARINYARGLDVGEADLIRTRSEGARRWLASVGCRWEVAAGGGFLGLDSSAYIGD
jgi:hypothetical protein